MPDIYRRDRGALVALFLILVSVVLVALLLAIGEREPLGGQVANGRAQQVQERDFEDGTPVLTSPNEPKFFGDTYAQWLMAAFAIVATGVSWRALYLLRQTFEETKTTASEAVEANRIARTSAERQLRAYLAVEGHHTPIRLAAGEPVKVTLKVTNVGATPANDVKVATGCCIRGKNWKEPDWTLDVDSTPDRMSLMPRADTVFFAGSKEANQDWVPDAKNIENVQLGTQRILFYGQISYTDTVTTPTERHYTRFQFEVDASTLDVGRIKISPYGNYAT